MPLVWCSSIGRGWFEKRSDEKNRGNSSTLTPSLKNFISAVKPLTGVINVNLCFSKRKNIETLFSSSFLFQHLNISENQTPKIFITKLQRKSFQSEPIHAQSSFVQTRETRMIRQTNLFNLNQLLQRTSLKCQSIALDLAKISMRWWNKND